MHDIYWDAFTKSAPHNSHIWATTDRGWLTIDGFMRGNYLEYPVGEFRDQAIIHAVVFQCELKHGYTPEPENIPWHERDPGKYLLGIGKKIGTFPTVELARAWMIENTIGQLALL